MSRRSSPKRARRSPSATAPACAQRPASIIEWTADQIRAETERIASALAADSPVRAADTRSTLAESAASLQVHMRILMAKEAAGVLPPEEARTIPATASALLRCLRELGATEAKNDPDEDEAL